MTLRWGTTGVNAKRPETWKPERGIGSVPNFFGTPDYGKISVNFPNIPETAMLAQSLQYITIEEYLEGEKESPIRYEYVDGIVFAMAGSSDKHNQIAGNLYTRLNLHLSDNHCRAFMSDMKLRIETTFYYPDVMVACDPPEGRDPYFRTQPVLVVEVTSPSTERTDKTEKLRAYKGVPSLREYLLLSQERMAARLYRRVGDEWEVHVFGRADDAVELESVGLSLSLGDIYRNVEVF